MLGRGNTEYNVPGAGMCLVGLSSLSPKAGGLKNIGSDVGVGKGKDPKGLYKPL